MSRKKTQTTVQDDMKWYQFKGAMAGAPPDLSSISHLPYVMVGGGAMREHGLRDRSDDTDLLMMSDTVPEAIQALEEAGWYATMSSGGFTADNGLGEQIDILTETGTALDMLGRDGFSEIINSSPNHVISKPWLLILKVIASRDKDYSDMSLLTAGMSDQDLNAAQELANRYAPWVADLIESELEMARMGFSWNPQQQQEEVQMPAAG